jgi:outer membrane protein assembly factor BamB
VPWLQDLAVGQDGRVAVAGLVNSGGQMRALVAAYDSDGAPLWTTFLGGGGGLTYGWSIAMDSTGEVTVAGATDESLARANIGAQDAFIAHLDSAGQVVWVQQFGTPENDLAIAVTDEPGDASLYVTGAQHQPLAPPWDGPPGANFMFVIHVARDGTPLWRHDLGTPANQSGKAVAHRPQGGVYASASSYTDGMLYAWDQNGQLLWQATPADLMSSTSIAVGGDGSIFVGGIDVAPEGNIDAVVVKFDENGVEQCF